MTGKRQTRYLTVRGTPKEAQAKRRELEDRISKGNDVAPSKLTLSAYMREWLRETEESGKIGARTMQRYNELATHHILLHLGGVKLQ